MDKKPKFVTNDKGLPLHNKIANVKLATESIATEPVIRHDEFTGQDTWSVDTPWGARCGDTIEDKDNPNFRHWCGQVFHFEPPANLVFDAWSVISRENSFDSLKDFADSLEWDGNERLNRLFSDYFEAEGDPEYLAQVSRKFVGGLITRAYEPGAKVDHLPVLEGRQGVGKSTFCKSLVGEQFFADWLPDLGEKDAALSLRGKWLIEMPELSTLYRSQLEAAKAFITRQVDKVRPPYGRLQIELPRRCVFIGTTNDPKYLRDTTGNRRFWPIKVGKLNFKALERDRLQLLGEAKFIYNFAKEPLWLTGKAASYLRTIHAEKLIDDDATVMAELIRDFYKEGLPKKLKMSDLFYSGPLFQFKFDGRNKPLAGRALQSLGYEKYISGGHPFWRRKTDGEPPWA